MCASEKIVREIKKTSESIRKKHRALKIGRIEEDMGLDRHFKSIISQSESIRKKYRALKTGRIEEDMALDRHFKSIFKLLRQIVDNSGVCALITSTPRTTIVSTIESLENVFETTDDSLATKVQNRLQTSEGREALQAGLDPLGQKHVEAEGSAR
ncbi:hypothetical protein G5I_01945 [Acromyrmex echinatior]|uniref:Uncharacterized protein n=1 Tax=Acromyrmex echinatior TaxID=103372 RepID=F4W8Z9_ACREC|nr:hypothetical protein G5I_01945 [Acromyrmex echinatior]